MASKCDQHFENLRTLLTDCQTGKDSYTIHKMIFECGALADCLAEKLDKTARKAVYLSWALVILSIALTLLTFALLFFTMYPPKP